MRYFRECQIVIICSQKRQCHVVIRYKDYSHISAKLSCLSSSITVDFPRHEDHPEEERSVDNFKGESGFPTIADVILRQPCQGVEGISCERLVCHVDLAVGIDVSLGSIEL